MSDVLANKIAAGEVVQRPESVVKELVENAIDAGATKVSVFLEQAGIKKVQVVDNGRGMSEADVRLCFLRHATSKITSIDDLQSVATLGFRGEALASIGAVARVRLRTRTAAAVAGTEARHEGGHTKWIGPCATNQGTSVSVRDLFYNVPARRKFLKSDNAELRRIVDLLQQIALSHPDIAFELEHDGRSLFTFAPDPADDDQEAIALRTARVFGASAEQLIAVREETSYLCITGVVGLPSLHRRSRGRQVFVVNGRVVKNRYLEHAVRGAYGDALGDGEHPLFVLFLDLAPGHVDVNVHPSKAEVKFDDERGVYALLRSVVGRAIASNHNAPALFDDGDPTVAAAQIAWRRDQPADDDGHLSRLLLGEQTDLMPGGAQISDQPEGLLERNASPDETWQLLDRYLVIRLRSGLLVVDQRAAHERVVYERTLSALNAGGGFSQQLLFPQSVELEPAQYALASRLVVDLKRAGFDLDPFGGNALLVRGVPAEMATGDIGSLLRDVIDRVGDGSTGDTLHDSRGNLAASIASCSAGRMSTRLSQPERRALVDQLLVCAEPATTPRGAKTMMTLEEREFRRWFGG